MDTKRRGSTSRTLGNRSGIVCSFTSIRKQSARVKKLTLSYLRRTNNAGRNTGRVPVYCGGSHIAQPLCTDTKGNPWTEPAKKQRCNGAAFCFLLAEAV